MVIWYHLTAFNHDLAIRIGKDGDDLGNNKVCLEQIDFTASHVASVTCLQELFGDWISINRTSSNTEYIFLCEVRIFGFDSKYSDIALNRSLHKPRCR